MVQLDVGPVAFAVAVGALAVIVIGWRGMARLAVDQSLVLKANIAPGFGIVTIRTLAGIVTCRPGVARLAIHQPAVIKAADEPTFGVMAVGALTGVVVGRRYMACGAVDKATVIELDLQPVGRDVTCRAYASIVTRWSLSLVAASTVGESCVVEPIPAPVRCVVAVLAQLVVMIVFAVAVRALGIAGVIEGDYGPIVDYVAA
jgi:hypothetical protein